MPGEDNSKRCSSADVIGVTVGAGGIEIPHSRIPRSVKQAMGSLLHLLGCPLGGITKVDVARGSDVSGTPDRSQSQPNAARAVRRHVPVPISSPLYSVGAASIPPSPMTIRPAISTVEG